MSTNRLALALLAPLALLAAESEAEAAIFSGNPILEIKVARPANDLLEASAYVNKVRVRNCDGEWKDYPVNAVKDLKAGFSLTVTGGDLCYVGVAWGSDVSVEAQSGSNWFVLQYVEPVTIVPVTVPADPVTLTPNTTVAGTFYGGHPRLWVTFN